MEHVVESIKEKRLLSNIFEYYKIITNLNKVKKYHTIGKSSILINVPCPKLVKLEMISNLLIKYAVKTLFSIWFRHYKVKTKQY